VIAEIEVVVRTKEQAQKFEVGKLISPGNRDLHRALEGPTSQEMLARMVIDWAADYASLDVDIRGRIEPETEGL
jgi:hypothetical protein